VISKAVTPLDRTSSQKESALYCQIFYQIRQWIREGRLKEGDMLPSERELAQMFDVSRVPVREALKVLEFVGVAEQVHGKGVFIKRISVNNLISNIDFVLMDGASTLLDLFEAREAIEIQAASLAALRWNEEDMAMMQGAIAAMEKKIQAGEDILETSMSFHTAVIAASHNKTIAEINLFLADWLRLARQHFMAKSTLHQVGLHNHQDILDRIKARDAPGAAAKMKEHLDRTRVVMEAGMKEVA